MRGKGQQQTIAGTSTAFDQAYAYDGLGRLTRIDYPGGVSAHYSYAHGRLSGLGTLQGANVRQGLTYGYNDADEITAITNAANAALSQRFAYDDASRLVDVTASGANQSFAYDANVMTQ